MCTDQNRRNGVSQASISISGSGLIRYRRRCASTRDSTNPASRSTRRCFETEGCGRLNFSSISPTERSEDASSVKIARRFGSAMIANVDSTPRIYRIQYIHVKPEAADALAILHQEV